MTKLSEIASVAYLYSRHLLSDQGLLPKYSPSAILNTKVSFLIVDITRITGLDAIVNAANNALGDGSGVNGAIHRAAGPDLVSECRRLGGCDTGDAKITRGYGLPAKYIIHTVGPVYYRHERQTSAKLLESCYRRCLEVAIENGVRSVAFSSISTGIFGYPIEEAAEIATSTVRLFLESEQGAQIDNVVFALFSKHDLEVYQKTIPQIFPQTI
ncbi:uncharacterized protein V1516DRAFT_387707 [Lipomyces oligophaga]|uniref:uncharacterized protein n=1 Tax=Lipomyces oligophaga TaxID=45792 RepID=UPI0034D00B80